MYAVVLHDRKINTADKRMIQNREMYLLSDIKFSGNKV